MCQVDAHNGKGVPAEGGDLMFDVVKGILIKVLDYTIGDRQIFYMRNGRVRYLYWRKGSQV